VSVFEFVATLYSIVIALGIARILSGYVALIEHRKEVHNLPLFVIWLSMLLLVHIVWWFSLWNRSDALSFTLFQAILTFHVPAFLFIACGLLIPGESALETITERYNKLRVPFLICFSIVFIPGPLLAGIAISDWSIAMYLVPIGVLLLVGTVSSNIRLQYTVALSAMVTYLMFAIQFRSSLNG
jgi:hypothetical protein